MPSRSIRFEPAPPLVVLAIAFGSLWGSAAASASSPWQVTDLHLRESVIYGVSCPSTHFCVGAGTGATPPEGFGSAGVIVSSRHPRGAASAWKVTLFPRRPRFTPQIRDVSCPSVRLCVAVANKGTVLTSTRPMGGRSAWKVTRLPAGSLRKVSCFSTSFCVIAGYYGKFFVTRTPTGGTGAWEPVQLDSSLGPTGISCPSTALCVAVGTSRSSRAIFPPTRFVPGRSTPNSKFSASRRRGWTAPPVCSVWSEAEPASSPPVNRPCPAAGA